MVATNFQKPSLNFVWAAGNDNPADGYHISPGDSGAGTKGGVTEATWANAVAEKIVTGLLRNATNDQLGTILSQEFWGDACNQLPAGLDFLLFNGRMMSGAYPFIMQRCLGFVGSNVDGQIGPLSIRAAIQTEPKGLINALTGAHYGYLQTLTNWPRFSGGWTNRLLTARTLALSMIEPDT